MIRENELRSYRGADNLSRFIGELRAILSNGTIKLQSEDVLSAISDPSIRKYVRLHLLFRDAMILSQVADTVASYAAELPSDSILRREISAALRQLKDAVSRVESPGAKGSPMDEILRTYSETFLDVVLSADGEKSDAKEKAQTLIKSLADKVRNLAAARNMAAGILRRPDDLAVTSPNLRLILRREEVESIIDLLDTMMEYSNIEDPLPAPTLGDKLRAKLYRGDNPKKKGEKIKITKKGIRRRK